MSPSISISQHVGSDPEPQGESFRADDAAKTGPSEKDENRDPLHKTTGHSAKQFGTLDSLSIALTSSPSGTRREAVHIHRDRPPSAHKVRNPNLMHANEMERLEYKHVGHSPNAKHSLGQGLTGEAQSLKRKTDGERHI